MLNYANLQSDWTKACFPPEARSLPSSSRRLTQHHSQNSSNAVRFHFHNKLIVNVSDVHHVGRSSSDCTWTFHSDSPGIKSTFRPSKQLGILTRTQRSLDRHHSLKSSACNCLRVWNRAEGLLCAAGVLFFMRLTCVKAGADTELWCLGWCWMILNESIMSRVGVEQPESLSSQRYRRITDNKLRRKWSTTAGPNQFQLAFRYSMLSALLFLALTSDNNCINTCFQIRSVNTLSKHKGVTVGRSFHSRMCGDGAVVGVPVKRRRNQVEKKGTVRRMSHETEQTACCKCLILISNGVTALVLLGETDRCCVQEQVYHS